MNDLKQPMSKKLLLMGLDNSGKTTILLSLKDNTNLLSYFSLKPTRGLSIESLEGNDYELSIWDCGGQEMYREEYINNFYKYTEDLDRLIFVIDVQAMDRYDLALSYLQNIIDLLQRDNLFVDVSVFLHKYDPNLEDQAGFDNIHEKVQTALIARVSEMIPLEFGFELHKTSVYTVFEQNLIKKREN